MSEQLKSEHAQVYSQLIAAIENHTPCVLVHVIHTENSTSANVGNKAIIYPSGEVVGWIGGGCCQGVVAKVAPEVLKNNQSLLIRVGPEASFQADKRCFPSGCASEGTVDLFLEPIANQPTLLLYGQTPVAESIARYSDELDIDLRRPSLDDEMVESHGKVAIVATQGQRDLLSLRAALATSAQHILFVASRKKAQSMLEKLHQQGAARSTLARVISPAGMDIGAVTNAEIALSVIAQAIPLLRDQELAEQTLQEETSTEEQQVQEAVTKNTVKTETTAASHCCGGA